MTRLQTEQGMVKVPAGTWTVDADHSSVAFEVKHMMISTVRGHFSEFDGVLEAAEDPEQSHTHGWVRTASVDTGNADRDPHRRGPDFFDAERFPEMRFDSTRIRHVQGRHVPGHRYLRGQIDRTDFGLTWQTRLSSGGMLVGEQVKILLDISAVAR